MTIDVAVTQVIERPVADVVAFVLDPANAHRWSKSVESAEWTTVPPTRLGSRVCFQRTGRVRSRTDEFEVCEYDPPEQVALRTVDTPSMTITCTWRPVGDRVTHMTLRSTGEVGGLPALVPPVTRSVMRRSMTDDVGALKQLMESS